MIWRARAVAGGGEPGVVTAAEGRLASEPGRVSSSRSRSSPRTAARWTGTRIFEARGSARERRLARRSRAPDAGRTASRGPRSARPGPARPGAAGLGPQRRARGPRPDRDHGCLRGSPAGGAHGPGRTSTHGIAASPRSSRSGPSAGSGGWTGRSRRRRGARSADLAPWVRALLRLTAYQLAFLDRIPAWAAVHEAVELAKRRRSAGATAFVNGVLRAIASAPRPWPAPTAADPVEALALRASHPTWLVERWWARYGPAGTEALAMRHERGAGGGGPGQHAAADDRRGGRGARGRGVGAAPARFAPEGFALERVGDLRQLVGPPGGERRRPGRGGHPGGACPGPAPRGDGRRRVRGPGDQDDAPGRAHGQSGPAGRRRPERGPDGAPPGGVRPARGRDRRAARGRRAAPSRRISGRRATASWSTPRARTSASSGATPTASGVGSPATSPPWSPPRPASSSPPRRWSGPAGSSSMRPARSSPRRTRRSWRSSGRAGRTSHPTRSRPQSRRHAGPRPTSSG